MGRESTLQLHLGSKRQLLCHRHKRIIKAAGRHALHCHILTATTRCHLIHRYRDSFPSRGSLWRAPHRRAFVHRKWPRGIRIPGACFVSTRPPKIRTGAGKRCFHRAGLPLNGQPQAKRRDMGGTQRPCQRPTHPNRMSLHHGQLAGCSLLSH